jgi:hypothetical protein
LVQKSCSSIGNVPHAWQFLAQATDQRVVKQCMPSPQQKVLQNIGRMASTNWQLPYNVPPNLEKQAPVSNSTLTAQQQVMQQVHMVSPQHTEAAQALLSQLAEPTAWPRVCHTHSHSMALNM